jgi:hypothetical protein
VCRVGGPAVASGLLLALQSTGTRGPSQLSAVDWKLDSKSRAMPPHCCGADWFVYALFSSASAFFNGDARSVTDHCPVARFSLSSLCACALRARPALRVAFGRTSSCWLPKRRVLPHASSVLTWWWWWRVSVPSRVASSAFS